MDRPSVFLLAGEASGDLHGAALALALRRARPDIELEGIGGRAMEQAGVSLLYPMDRFAVLGISEVVSRIPFFLRALDRLKKHLRDHRPGLFIPIDFPDFNIRLAAAARKLGVPVLYYISPQVWAWRPGRIRTLARVVNRMLVVFPFEAGLYRARGVPVDFVGHPLLDKVGVTKSPEQVRSELAIAAGPPLVALLPGSRVQEIERILPPLLDAAGRLMSRGAAAAVSRADSVPGEVFGRTLRRAGVSIPVWEGPPYDLVAASDLAVVASGTATLEAGLLGTPLIVVYKMSPLSWSVARRLVKLPCVGLVNIAAGRQIAPELLQGDVNGANVARVAQDLLDDPERRAAMRRALEELPARLGGRGASERAARIALELLDAGRSP